MSPAASLTSLPKDVLLCSIVPALDLPSLVALAQVAKKLRSAISETDWQQACYHAGFTRCLIHAARPWRQLASALSYHAQTCLACKPHFVRTLATHSICLTL